MRARIVAGVAVVVAVFGIGSLAGRADVTPSRQWTIVNFPDPVQVKDELVMGPVLIVHDSEKMARGEACTTFYRFKPGKGPAEELVSFHCDPRRGKVVADTVFTYSEPQPNACRRLLSYQVAGDSEVHLVPTK